jgi:hypothetical protein
MVQLLAFDVSACNIGVWDMKLYQRLRMFRVFSSYVRDHPSSSDARVEDTKWQKVVVVDFIYALHYSQK